ncbi:nucleotidyl transferase AbiEii/AbiGii toxin family protein [Nonomuraea jiangxiensis]|uniref:Nucleotidyl transferase AbiEii toxin, Type IV TA system n=1 Tax=Nonomuraea jiangxiensis TaxID=633440 RepID=A0A1G8FN56_9ACTN|nr:nucleotidyl transferase AbiEii/AbiGii toxin family protein [Nonomuraea jiangxiensis]SDH83603.1 Nucleotidyl transferase AbiEii toxin, Type IV TA system [Nonomuraea jiangxiensis]
MTTAWEQYQEWQGPRRRSKFPERGAVDFPSTYVPEVRGDGMHQPPIFDPALKHIPHAFRAGEPLFEDLDVGRRWRRARRMAMDHLVRIVAESPWAENLVLRGSLLLESWIGEQARDPGDLDWVVVPASLKLERPPTVAMFRGIIATVAAVPETTGTVAGIDAPVLVDAGDIAVDDIWTYERAPGRRLVFPWRTEGLPPGTVQLDFVFNEEMPMPPTTALIPRAGGGDPTLVQAATPELSLVWKILWLASDAYPMGKDLYDAVLLAERVTPPRELLHQVLDKELGDGYGAAFDEDKLRLLEVDWPEFQAEYPQIEGDGRTWKERLAKALRPVLGSGS